MDGHQSQMGDTHGVCTNMGKGKVLYMNMDKVETRSGLKKGGWESLSAAC